MPFPANYGGVIDVYYKLFWLKEAGVKIHLHCFTYGREPAAELEKLCEKVYYYKRKTGLASNLSFLPYTVKSRQSTDLENNLLLNDYPILFEVLHTCHLMGDLRFADRKKIYRHSNIEHDYYRELAKTERHFLKKIFLIIESFKLKRFERVLDQADLILAVNQKDTDYFKKEYPWVPSVYLPSFHANKNIQIKEGKGDYILFHGNLSISENYEAALWLLQNVFSKIKNKLVITGLNPPEFLKHEIEKYNHVELKENPTSQEMDELIVNAHIHVLYTLQATGLKLKLLNVLFKGRFIICNEAMLAGTGISENGGLYLANDAEMFVNQINYLLGMVMDEKALRTRQNQLINFDNQKNAAQLITFI